MSEVSQKQLEANRQNAKLDGVKKEARQAEIESLRKSFAENVDLAFTDPKLEELVDLQEKKELTAQDKKRKREIELEIVKAFGLKNGIWAANVSYGRYHEFLATTRGMLVKEYDCKTSIELMLVDRIVANYWRSMRLDTTLNQLIEKEEGGYTFNDSKMTVIRELSKGLESASRQLNTSIMLLKELKQPTLNVRVKNAIIGQNQQFNVNRQNSQQQDEKDEIIEPK